MKTTFGTLLVASSALLSHVSAAPAPAPVPVPDPSPVLEDRAAKVTVSLSPSSAVVGGSALNVESFRGIPFAQPPTGSLRLKPPVKLDALPATFDATAIEAACPQFFFSTDGNDFLSSVLGDIVNIPFFQTVTNQKEDCLTINVMRPAGTKPEDKLPVLFWIFGGGFEVRLLFTPLKGTRVTLTSHG